MNFKNRDIKEKSPAMSASTSFKKHIAFKMFLALCLMLFPAISWAQTFEDVTNSGWSDLQNNGFTASGPNVIFSGASPAGIYTNSGNSGSIKVEATGSFSTFSLSKLYFTMYNSNARVDLTITPYDEFGNPGTPETYGNSTQTYSVDVSPNLDFQDISYFEIQVDDVADGYGDATPDLTLQGFDYQLPAVNTPPTFTTLANVVETTNEDTGVEIFFSSILGQADANDSDGTVDAFVVQSVSSGTLTINGSAFSPGTNDEITPSQSANWTPAANANGTLNAFTITAKDDAGDESSTAVQAQVAVNAVADIFYVNDEAPGTDDGSSWTNAYTDLQSALAIAAANEEIWVAAGTYYPTSGTDRMQSFTIDGAQDGLKIYGGFAGTESNLSERDLSQNPTILDGDIGTKSDSLDNSYHVLVFDGKSGDNITNATILDGFIIQNGNAIGSDDERYGGGISCFGSGSGNECSPRLSNLMFIYNTAYGNGGGLYNSGHSGGNSSPVISNTIFYGNKVIYSFGQGGAVANYGIAGTSSPIYTNVSFIKNSATSKGGAIYNRGYNGISETEYTNIIIWGNTSGDGSQIYNANATSSFGHSIIEGGLAGINNFNSSVVDNGNNLDTNPEFLAINNPAGADGTLGTTDDGLQLTINSPALNSGDNSVASLPSKDLLGLNRTYGGTTDIGAYELKVDFDGNVTTAAAVSEPVGIASSKNTSGQAVDIFDFAITDGGSGDSKPLTVSQLKLHAGGTMDPSKLTFRLDGPDVSDVTGSYNAGTITFSGLSISVSDGASETYTINAYYSDNSDLTDGQKLMLSIDGDTDVTTGNSTQMGTTSPVDNGSGSTVDIIATKLAFTTQPAPTSFKTNGSVTSFTTVPVVKATDANGNIDTGYSTDIQLAEVNGPGSATMTGTGDTDGSGSTVTLTPASGAATFSDLAINYTPDNVNNDETFNIRASSGGLTTANSTQLTALGNDAPTFTTLSAAVATTNEDTDTAITFADINSQADANDSDGTVEAFVVQSVTSGSLLINGSAYAAGSNDEITSTKNANWTPDVDANGTLNAFTVTAKDDMGTESSPAVQAQVEVTAVNDNPAVTGITSDITVTEDTESNVDLSSTNFSEVEGDNITVTLRTSGGSFSTPASGAGVGGGVTTTLGNSSTITLAGATPDINTYLDTPSNIKYTGPNNVSGNNAATITVEANDGHGSGDVTLGTINIDITAVNDHPTVSPAISTLDNTVDEDSPVPSIGLLVDDVEIGGSGVTVTANSDNQTLVPDANISVTDDGGGDRTLDITLAPNESGIANITVTLDDGTNTVSDSFQLTVDTQNDPPAISLDQNSNTIPENNGGNVTVAQITINDDNEAGSTNNLSLSGADAGSFAINGSDLDFTGSADFEAKTTYNVDVEVDDPAVGGTPDNTAGFTLNISDVNETGSFTATGPFNISESASNGTTVGDIDANDGDGGATDAGITYSIISGNTGSAFVIDPTTGGVSVNDATAVDFDASPTFTLTVEADDGTNAPTASVTINVNNAAPSTPVDSDGTNGGSVAENAANGTAVDITADASDPGGGNVSYALTDDAGGRFQINASTGIVTVGNGSLLDFENASSHEIRVQASDDDGADSGVSKFTISITDVDEVPVFTAKGPFTIDEGSANGTSVGDVDAIDGDAGATDANLSYSIIGGNTNSAFSIDNDGRITVANSSALDFNTKSSFTLDVEADDGTNAPTAQVTVNITDVNDAPSITNTPAGTTDEDAAYSFTPAVSDPDVGDTSTFSITNKPAWAGFNTGTGELSGTPVNDDVGNYTGIEITVEDGAGSTDSVGPFSINVTNTNDAPVVGAGISDQSATENNAFSFTLPGNAFNDVDAGDALSLSAAGLPDGLTFNTSTNTISGTPTSTDLGNNTVTITAEDQSGATVNTTFTLTIDPEVPGKIVLTTPADADEDIALSPNMQWQQMASANTYELQIAPTSSFTNPVVNQTGVSQNSYQLSATLDRATTYYWRVRGFNSGAYGNWSDTFTFTTIPEVPQKIVLDAPSDEKNEVALKPEFSWQSRSSAESYNLQIATDASFSPGVIVSTESGIASNHFQAKSDLQRQNTYYWRVRGVNAGGLGSWSDSFRFSTIPNVPGKVVLTLPGNNNDSINPDVRLEWKSANRATAYNIQLATDENFTASVITKQNISGTSQSLSDELQDNTNYFWRVQATNSGGSGSWSDTWNFTTRASAPTLGFPSPNEKDISIAPRLSWNSEYENSQYHLRVGLDKNISNTVIDTVVKTTYMILRGLDTDTQYHWQVRIKNESNSSPWSTVRDFTTRIPPQENPVDREIVFGDAGNGNQGRKLTAFNYRLVGLPGNKTILVNELFDGKYGEDWKVFEDNGAQQDFLVEYSEESPLAFTPGKGFWVLSKKPVNIEEAMPSVTISENDTYSIALAPGWNIISNPFNKRLNWDHIQKFNDFETTLYSYEGSFAASREMAPFTAYYVYNDNDSGANFTLDIPYTSLDKRGANQDKFSAKKDTQKEITLTVASEDQKAHSKLHVVYPDDPEIRKKSNRYHPPLELSKFGASFVEEKNEARKKFFQTLGDNYDEERNHYRVVVKSTMRQQIHWKAEIKGLDRSTGVLVVDPKEGRMQTLQHGAQYSFMSNVGRKEFDVYVGSLTELNAIKDKLIPQEFTLKQNYPNPFNPTTTIRFGLQEKDNVQLEVFDILGRKVQTLVNDTRSAGWHNVKFDARRLASGTYFYRLIIGQKVKTQKMMLIK